MLSPLNTGLRERMMGFPTAFTLMGLGMDSPVSAAQGYDSIYLLAAAIKQAGSTEGPKVKAALEDLKTPVEGVVATYNKPYSHTDHEAINFENTKFGEVHDGRVVPVK